MAIIWQLSITHTQTGSNVRGTILNGNPFINNRQKGILSHMYATMRSYFIRPVAHRKLNLVVAGNKVSCKTNKYGEFNIETASKIARIDSISIDGNEVRYEADYPVYFGQNSAAYEAISDIDDTIMVTYATQAIRRILTLLFTRPSKRSKISYTYELSAYLKGLNVNMSFVSKSEGNLFGLITTFITHHGFPKGPIYLTPYLSLKELIFSKKNRFFKEDRISHIIENSSKQFILIGDDSQRDMDVYANMVVRFEKRITKVVIRQTRRVMKSSAKSFLNKLKATGVDVIIFNDEDSFDQELFKLIP